jgi:L-alanine-DL-glutamate epimerase-like enolase superfamily enzyme
MTMKLRVRTADLRLRHTFTISRSSRDVVRTVIVEVESDGIVGYGEASPSAYYGHTPESVAASLERARPILERADPLRWRSLIADLAPLGDRAAIAALDIAIHDWAGKRLGLPLHRILGLDPARMPPSSFTIGIDTTERMVEKAREAARFPILKVKLGTSRDLEIVGALRKATGATIRVDANGAWTPAEAVERSKALRDLGVEFIEQPLPADSIEAMAEVRRASALPLYADESAVTARDVPALAGRFDGIVVKLVKCGGILGALRMMEVARAVDLKVMIGCMIESSISISAAAQIGPLADHLDLDGAILIANDPFEGAANEHGTMILPEGAGLGVRPRREPPR